MSQPAYTYACMQDTGSAARQLTLYVIAEHINVETGKTYCGIKKLMREAHVKSDRTMRNYLAELEVRGFIKREKRQRENGANSTDFIELVGFLDWYASNGGPVVSPAAKSTGGVTNGKNYRGAARITGGSGNLATGHNDHLLNDLKDPPLPPKGGRSRKSRIDTGAKRQPAVAARYVSEEALDKMGSIASGWDRQHLLARFLEWPGSANARNMDAAFLGWAKSFTKGKDPYGNSIGQAA